MADEINFMSEEVKFYRDSLVQTKLIITEFQYNNNKKEIKINNDKINALFNYSNYFSSK